MDVATASQALHGPGSGSPRALARYFCGCVSQLAAFPRVKSADAEMLMQQSSRAPDGRVGDWILAAAISVLRQLSAVPAKTQLALLSTCVLLEASSSSASAFLLWDFRVLSETAANKETPTSWASSHRSRFSSINMLESD